MELNKILTAPLPLNNSDEIPLILRYFFETPPAPLNTEKGRKNHISKNG